MIGRDRKKVWWGSMGRAWETCCQLCERLRLGEIGGELGDCGMAHLSGRLIQA